MHKHLKVLKVDLHRMILIQEFHLLKAKRRSSEHAHSRTHREHSKHPNDKYISRARLVRALSFSSFLRSLSVRSPTAAPCTRRNLFWGKKFPLCRSIFVSVSHVRRAQSSCLDEVPNFLERRSASQSVLFTIFRNSDIDAHRACGE